MVYHFFGEPPAQTLLDIMKRMKKQPNRVNQNPALLPGFTVYFSLSIRLGRFTIANYIPGTDLDER